MYMYICIYIYIYIHIYIYIIHTPLEIHTQRHDCSYATLCVRCGVNARRSMHQMCCVCAINAMQSHFKSHAHELI